MSGVKGNKHNLELMCKHHNPDIVAIQEGRLNIKRQQKNTDSTSLKILGYDTKITKTFGDRYDLITLFKKGTSITPVNDTTPAIHPIDTYKVRFRDCKTEHTITNIYVKHDNKLDSETLEHITDSQPNNIIMGDFNNTSHYRAKQTDFKKLINDLDLYNTNTENITTNYSRNKGGNTETTIDHILIDNNLRNTHTHTEVLNGYNSGNQHHNYHVPLMTTIEINSEETNIPKRNSRKMEEKTYKDCLKTVLEKTGNPVQTIQTIDDIENEVKNIENIILETLDICNPKKVPKKITENRGNDRFTRLLMRKKSWAQTKIIEHENSTLGEAFKTMRQILDKKIKEQHVLEKKKAYTKVVHTIMDKPLYGREFYKISRNLKKTSAPVRTTL